MDWGILFKTIIAESYCKHTTANFTSYSYRIGYWDLDELMVIREWQNINILLTDEQNRLVVIIENKIDSSEHGEQLQRYWRIVNQHYPDWHIVGLYLTPDGNPPTDDNYLPVDYTSICKIT